MTDRPAAEAQSFTARISMWSARRRKILAVAWVVIVILGLGTCFLVETDTDIDQEPPGETGEAVALFEERFGDDEGAPTEFVVFAHETLTVEDAAYQATVLDLLAELQELRAPTTESTGNTAVTSSIRIITNTTSHYDLPEEFRAASPFTTKDRHVTFAIVEGDALDDSGAITELVIDTVAEFEAPAGFEILIGGEASLNEQVMTIVEEDFGRALFLNLPITFVILLLAFGAVLAAAVPLILAFAAIITATGILALVSRIYPLDVTYSEMVLLMGLATGIDYSLFVVTRFRRERAAGRATGDALRAASGTSGKAVVFAGATVVLAIGGMFLVDDVIFSSLALASIVVVMLAVVISVTLLPALLAMLGDNVNRLRIPFLGGEPGEHGGIWGMITDQVLARPAVLATAALIGLLALASPIFPSVIGTSLDSLPGINLGFNGVKSLPAEAEATKALGALEHNFTLGLAQPAVVLVDAGEKQNVFAADIQEGTGALLDMVHEESVANDPDNAFGIPAQPPEFNDAGDTEILFIPINADSDEPKAIDAVNHLRNDLVPAAFENTSGDVYVTGATAANIDFRDKIIFRTPIVFAFVLGLAFIILLLMFRSIVIPIKAIVLNLLSVGAAYGVLVLVFQEGWLLENVLDFEATGIIESWLPLFMFAILFGLSMDYHMFVLGRIKEAYERGAGNDEAISIGVKATAGTITSAAAIMVAVFMIFAFTRLIGLKQFGLGLAVAILLDATVIRSILLPASMKLLGPANWYLPSWLEWLPRVQMAE